MKLAVDASALLAILLKEPGAGALEAKLLTASELWISPINWWEVQVRVRSEFGEIGVAKSEALMAQCGIKIAPAAEEHARIALAASARFKGRPHRLNLGDCFAYALAQAKHLPLLYKGDDLSRTDVPRA